LIPDTREYRTAASCRNRAGAYGGAMDDQPRSLQAILADHVPGAETAELGRAIGSQLPEADFRTWIGNVILEADRK
jgi:hypothetical protein